MIKRLVLIAAIAIFSATLLAPAIFAQPEPNPPKSDVKSGKKHHNNGQTQKQQR